MTRKKLNHFTRECGACKGTGRVRLRKPLAETLHILDMQEEWVTVAHLAATVGCQPTTMNNRLELLRKLGLAYREQLNGKVTLWSARSGRKPR